MKVQILISVKVSLYLFNAIINFGLICSNESGHNADINDDGILNVIDVIELVNIILN